VSVRTTFRSDEELDRRLRIAAELDGRSRSGAIRLAVEAYIASVAQRHGAAVKTAAPGSPIDDRSGRAA
jgi:predicted transcriptional regulator